MNQIEDYFNSKKDKIIIDSDVFETIKKEIELNPHLKEIALKNLDKILDSDSPFKTIELEMWLKNFSLDFNVQATLEEDGKFVVAKRPIKKLEPNSLRIQTKSCGVIQFRVPPNTVKTAAKSGEPIAQYYVITERTFYNGINYIDISFPIFENFFMHNQRKTYFLCINEELKKKS